MDMNILAFALAACAVGFTGGNQYPAGVDPRSCPNYPDCDNAALHGSPAATTAGIAWNSDGPVAADNENSWDSWGSTNSWNAAPPVAPSVQYPAGVDPQSCPNYPNCDNAALHGGALAPPAAPGSWGSVPRADWNTADSGHAPGLSAPQYPAGVNAQSCPNYPYCA